MRTDDELYKLCFPEHTAETLDFWRYGRQGIHRWTVPIEPANVDLTQYDRMTICLHIWVFTLTEPVHSFCHNRYQGKSREQTTFWCVLRTVTLKMQHRSWIRCWASSIPSSAAFGAERVLLAAINYSRSLVTFDII